jgi:acyl-CoA thioesterase-2
VTSDRPLGPGSPGPGPTLGQPGLQEILSLERLEVDLFRGRSPHEDRIRVFGGQAVAQALRAAQLTVDADHDVHSLHSYFLRGGDWRVPIVYQVDRIRDGQAFTTRRVVAVQQGQAIFNLEASFQVPEPGPAHQVDMAAGVPPPQEVPPDHFAGVVDSREVRWGDIAADRRPARWIWFRVPEELPADPALHSAALAYASDHGPMGGLRAPHGGYRARLGMQASLDHLLWFTAPTDAGAWHFYECRPAVTRAARGLAHGTIHRADGTLVAVTAQEGLLRPRHG